MPDKYSVICRAPSNSLLSLLSTILHLLGAAAVWDYCNDPNVTEKFRNSWSSVNSTNGSGVKGVTDIEKNGKKTCHLTPATF